MPGQIPKAIQFTIQYSVYESKHGMKVIYLILQRFKKVHLIAYKT